MAALDDLIQELSAAPAARVRPMWQCFALWLGLCALYMLVLVVFSGVRPDLGTKLWEPMFLAELVLLLLIMASTGLAALLLAYPDMHQAAALVYVPVLPVLGFVALLGVGGMADNTVVAHGLECIVEIVTFSLLPSVGLFYYMRKQASTHVVAAGMVALMAAFSMGCFVLRLSEQTDSVIHLIIWHYVPMIGASLAGMGLGRIILKW